MGFLTLLRNLGNAEGARQSVLISYRKHLNSAKRGQGPGDETPPEHIGLYGALGVRYRNRGLRPAEPLLWAELAPFLLMSPVLAPEVLAEYIVYQELPGQANTANLRNMINKVLRIPASSAESPRRHLAPLAFMNGVSWMNLLDVDVRECLEKEAREMADAIATNE